MSTNSNKQDGYVRITPVGDLYRVQILNDNTGEVIHEALKYSEESARNESLNWLYREGLSRRNTNKGSRPIELVRRGTTIDDLIAYKFITNRRRGE